MSHLIYSFPFSFYNLGFSDITSLWSQAFVKSLLLYSYARKVSVTQARAEGLRKKLVDIVQENAKLRETLAKQDEELLILGRHSSVMQCEASKASMAKDQAEAKLAKLFEELKSLQAEHAELQKDYSILKEVHRLLKEKNSEVLGELEANQASKVEAQASVVKAKKGKLVAKEKYKHFWDLYKKLKLLLKEANAKAANYLH